MEIEIVIGDGDADEDANEDGSVLNGDIISNSSASIQDGQWEVSMTMQPAAAQKWSKITLKNIDNQIDH